MTALCIPITAKNVATGEKLIKQARSAGAEMLEIRLDYLDNPVADAVCQLVQRAKNTGLPIIATCRSEWEGGRFKGNEQDRLAILKTARNCGADYLDVEWAALSQSATEWLNKPCIVSCHDFRQLPYDFNEKVAQITSLDNAIAKLAYQAQRLSDCFAALDMLHENPHSIAIAMSTAGFITRLLAKKLQAFLSFASLADENASAPGQIPIRLAKSLFNWDKINPETLVYGVIGHPLGHSLSPHIHNGAFAATGFNGLYLPLLVEPTWEAFQAFINGIRKRPWLDFRGMSVTIPHKQNALRYVKQAGGFLEPLADTIGAVNTLIIDINDKIHGFNTDYAGALDAITGTVGIKREDLAGMPTAIIGAGGVCRALVAGLTRYGARVTIYNRTEEKARRLAEEFACQWKPLAELAHLDTRLVINGTSIGMFPAVNNSPVPPEQLKKDMIVFDTVYNPRETKLLRDARAAGCCTVDGLTMFVNQAVLQFEKFTGMSAPRDYMYSIAAQYLQ